VPEAIAAAAISPPPTGREFRPSYVVYAQICIIVIGVLSAAVHLQAIATVDPAIDQAIKGEKETFLKEKPSFLMLKRSVDSLLLQAAVENQSSITAGIALVLLGLMVPWNPRGYAGLALALFAVIVVIYNLIDPENFLFNFSWQIPVLLALGGAVYLAGKADERVAETA